MRSLLRSYRFGQLCSYGYANVTLKIDQANKAAHLTLSNVKKRNPLSHQTIKEVQSALSQISARIQPDQLKILVLRGDGPVFSAGHDLKELKATKEPEKIFDDCTKALFQLKNLPIITLCGINGVAAAAGFQMALTCDLILATEKSTFSTPGVKWGLFCSTPGVQLVRSINSQKKANEMLLFGEPITAEQAFKYGLVNKVVTNDKLEEEISNYIEKTSHLSGEVIALGKRVLSNQSTLDIKQAYCVATDGMKENILTKEDCQEGLTAFAEKRHPHFKN